MDSKSRLDKFEKRRKNKKRISLLLLIAGVLVVVLAGIWLFGNGSNEASNQPAENENIKITEDDGDNGHETNDTEQADKDDSEKDKEDSTDDKEINKKKVETDDSNVVEAYTADWDPAGTDQSGPHTTNYDDGSEDRKEIAHAAADATGLDENDLTTYWVGNAGDQNVTTTIYNSDQSEIYRVALSWVENKGWQVTKVEKLKEPAH
ncbi:YrrS family protein [Virgibacillus halophilus]|uniref:YrrS family protein n=1 Tax=Tigheibacillus halophilus TaxID=361280 RepID=A0ABU5CDD5_9BACI|nr:YrrS family protein [Virgibacillus halophilus]